MEAVVSFKLFVLNDLDAITMPPQFSYAPGMDVIFKTRALAHLLVKELHAMGAEMTDAFAALAVAAEDAGSESEESWAESEP